MNAIETGANGLVETNETGDKPKLFSVDEVAAWLHMHPGNIRKMAVQGRLNGNKVMVDGKLTWRFKPEDVQAYQDSLKK